MRYAIKEVGKPLEIKETTEKYRIDIVKKEVKGYVEFVYLNPDRTFSMGVDEDGLPKELETNFYFETSNEHIPIQKAVGTIVFTRVKYARYIQSIF